MFSLLGNCRLGAHEIKKERKPRAPTEKKRIIKKRFSKVTSFSSSQMHGNRTATKGHRLPWLWSEMESAKNSRLGVEYPSLRMKAVSNARGVGKAAKKGDEM